MTNVTRWMRFNAVGVLGMGVQLVALAGFNRVLHGHYLLATGAALELTLLHNFWWHRRFTWGDRTGSLLRFHMSNGAVSLVGNLLLMRLLVHGAHVPLIVANIIAIVCCSLANFALGTRWAFAVNPVSKGRPPLQSTMIAILLLALCALPARAQNLPAAHQPAPAQRNDLGTDCAYENVFVGAGASLASSDAGPAVLGGVTFGQYFARPLGEGVALTPQFELGLLGPIHGGPPLDGLASFNLMLINQLPGRHLYGFFTAGYTRVFVSGNAVNAGIGIDFGRDEFRRVTRLELRDYYLFTGPSQHVLSLRLGLGKFIHD